MMLWVEMSRKYAAIVNSQKWPRSQTYNFRRVRRHGIYKYQQTHGGIPSNRRSLSLSAVQRDSSLKRDLDPSLQRLHEPGGMRRHYVIHRAVERGEDQPVVLRSFVDFLFLYGHFVSCQKKFAWQRL